MVPFEAALLNTPTILARCQSLRDLIPQGSVPELTFDAQIDAQTILTFSSENVRQEVCSTLAGIAHSHNTERYGARLTGLFESVLGN